LSIKFYNQSLRIFIQVVGRKRLLSSTFSSYLVRKKAKTFRYYC